MTADPDLSAGNTYRQWTEEWWEHRTGPEIVRCVGHKKSGNRCKHAALNGSNVCAYHGGRAPQVQQRAKVRIQMATEMAAKELLGMASDTTIPEGVRLSAIKDILDRGGLSIRQGVDVEVTSKPFEKVFGAITSKRPEVIDVEVEEDEEDPGSLKARLRMKREVDEYSDIVPRDGES